MTREILDRDPFGVTADPGAYIPRLATERALAALEQGLAEGVGPLVLCGPAGLGKTLLLHVLALRLQPRLRAVVLPYSALSPAEICVWALDLLGEPAQAGDPEAALLAHAARLQAQGSGLLLLLDDAGSMPADTARRMAQLAADSRGALRLVGAAVDDARSGRVLAALGADAREIRLSVGMDPRETALYVRARLERMGAGDDERRRFDAETLERISRSSGGVPRVVQQLASEVLWRRGDARVRPAWALSTEPLPEDEDVAAAEVGETAEPVRSDARLATLLERREPEEAGEGAIWRALSRTAAERSAPETPASRASEAAPPAAASRIQAAAPSTPQRSDAAPETSAAEPAPAVRREPAAAPEASAPLVHGLRALKEERRVAPPSAAAAVSAAPTSRETRAATPSRPLGPAVPDRTAAAPRAGARARPSERTGTPTTAGRARRAPPQPAAASGRTRRVVYAGLALAVVLAGALLLLRLLPPQAPTRERDTAQARPSERPVPPAAAQPAPTPMNVAPPPTAPSPTPESAEAPSSPEPVTPPRVEAPAAATPEAPAPAAPAASPAAAASVAPSGATASPATAPPAVSEPSPAAAAAATPAASESAASAPTAAAPAAATPRAPETPAEAAPPPTPAPQEAASPPPVAAPAPPTAVVVPTIPVHVNATPWASIEVDGQSLGETPLAGIPLTPGTHRFRASFPGGRVVEREVRIDARHRRVVFR